MSDFLPKLKNSNGLTLIELLLVVTIMLTLGVMSISFYSRFLTQNAIDNNTTQLAGSFRKAQIYSMMGKQNGIWGVKYGSNKITLYLSGKPAFDENYSVNENITISGFSDISFARITGLPIGTTPVTISIASGSNSKTITINSQGVVSR